MACNAAARLPYVVASSWDQCYSIWILFYFVLNVQILDLETREVLRG
jgi:hypothetical protein